MKKGDDLRARKNILKAAFEEEIAKLKAERFRAQEQRQQKRKVMESSLTLVEENTLAPTKEHAEAPTEDKENAGKMAGAKMAGKNEVELPITTQSREDDEATDPLQELTNQLLESQSQLRESHKHRNALESQVTTHTLTPRYHTPIHCTPIHPHTLTPRYGGRLGRLGRVCAVYETIALYPHICTHTTIHPHAHTPIFPHTIHTHLHIIHTYTHSLIHPHTHTPIHRTPIHPCTHTSIHNTPTQPHCIYTHPYIDTQLTHPYAHPMRKSCGIPSWLWRI